MIAAVVVALLVVLIVIIVFGLGAMWSWRPSGVPAPGVTILAEAPGLALWDVETQVAWPIESQVSGAAGVQQVRSASRFGICSVSVDFEPKTNIFEARQRLVERLQRAMTELPPNVTPVLAPISVSEREVLLIGLQSIAEPKTTEDRTTNGMAAITGAGVVYGSIDDGIDIRHPTFQNPDGTTRVRADCNTATGGFDAGPYARLSLGRLAVTQAVCLTGSLGDADLKGLADVSGHRFDGDHLVLLLRYDGGTMRFVALKR